MKLLTFCIHFVTAAYKDDFQSSEKVYFILLSGYQITGKFKVIKSKSVITLLEICQQQSGAAGVTCECDTCDYVLVRLHNSVMSKPFLTESQRAT